MTDHDTDEVWLRDVDVAARYKITRKSVWNWARTGKIPAPVRFTDGTTRWRRSALIAREAAHEAA